jgi:hypothetical protein
LAVGVVVAAADLVRPAWGIVTSRIDWQVTANPADAGSWSSSLVALPGQQVYARALVTYLRPDGGLEPLGLASFVFQPTIAGWDNTPGTGDVLLPFVNGGAGGNTTTPVGVLTPAQAADTVSFGRLSPWGRGNLTSTSALRGFFHVNPYGDGVSYLRIAQSQVTSWIGGPGNTTGGSGVPISQLSDVGRTTSDPPFSSEISNIYVLKLGIVFSQTSQPHTLVIDAPANGFGNRNTTNGDREVYWFMGMDDPFPHPGGRGPAEVHAATISNVPGPGCLGTMAGFALARRRRRGARAAARRPNQEVPA